LNANIVKFYNRFQQVKKSGMTPLTEVIGFGESARGKGLFFVDTREMI
jgi:altronate dehydratase